jgi:hypothetical protein
MRFAVINGARRDLNTHHLLKAKGLCAKLDFEAFFMPESASFVINWKRKP